VRGIFKRNVDCMSRITVMTGGEGNIDKRHTDYYKMNTV
jgi:hypothetical protein